MMLVERAMGFVHSWGENKSNRRDKTHDYLPIPPSPGSGKRISNPSSA
jgi:hypothetical protein